MEKSNVVKSLLVVGYRKTYVTKVIVEVLDNCPWLCALYGKSNGQQDEGALHVYNFDYPL